MIAASPAPPVERRSGAKPPNDADTPRSPRTSRRIRADSFSSGAPPPASDSESGVTTSAGVSAATTWMYSGMRATSWRKAR